MKNHWIIIYLFITCHMCGLIYGDQELSPSYASQLNHPDKHGYQSVVPGSDKHKYGYQLKTNGKHFHHTSTEKDGVRLGCYGYELDGKEYITQYVADARGYRLVTTEDLITVYPKYGESEGKASFGRPFNFDEDRPRDVRYFFPKGCKGIDVQIDNSSRLRSLKHFDSSAKLPVTFKPVLSDAYLYNTPPHNYPGPSNIYVPNFIQTARPPTFIRPNKPPTNTYIPPEKPNNTYLPPEKPTNTYLPPETPSNAYLPPEPSQENYVPPETPIETVTNQPESVNLAATDYPDIDPLPEEPDNTYLPPNQPENTYLPPSPPNNTYLPPIEPENTYLPPSEPENTYISPAEPNNTYVPPSEPDNTYIPPPLPNNTYIPPNEATVPPYEEIELLPPPCSANTSCCKDSLGKIVIPIRLKGQKTSNCCNYAKIILPLKFFEGIDLKKFKQSLPEELDTNMIVRRILENLL